MKMADPPVFTLPVMKVPIIKNLKGLYKFIFPMRFLKADNVVLVGQPLET